MFVIVQTAFLEAMREWLVAAGTLSASTVALYVAVLRDRHRRPVLSIEPFRQDDKADGQIVGMGKIGREPTTRAAYARLRVRNENGKHTAQEVQILVEEVELDSLSVSDSEYVGELPLAVSGSWPTEVHLNIPPGVARHFDCIHVRKDEADNKERVVNLDIVPTPADRRQRIPAQRKIELRVVLAARNADAQRYKIEIEYDGIWPEAEPELFGKHLRVSVLRLRARR